MLKSFLKTTALLLTLWVVPYFSCRAQEEITLERYARKLRELNQVARQSREKEDQSILQAYLRTFPAEFIVSFPRGQDSTERMYVNHVWVQNYFQLETRAKTYRKDSARPPFADLDRLILETEAEAQAAEEMAGIGNPDAEDLDKARRLLEEKLYQYKKKDNKQDETTEQDPDAENRAQRDKDARISTRQLIYTLIAALLVAAFIIGALRFFRLIDFTKVPEPEPMAGQGLLSETDPRESEKIIALADKFRNDGDIPTSLRYYYLGLILSLHENRIIPYRSSYTNWEYYLQMLKKGFPHEQAWEVTSIFDESHYGGREISPLQFDRFRSQLGTLMEKAGGKRA